MPAAVLLQSLTKSYRGERGIVDVDLAVAEGEVVGYLGPNGAGKSTTLRLLLDLIRPTSGSATVLGLDAQRQGVEIRRRVGYLPGDLALYGHMTGDELLDLFADLRDDDVDPRLRSDLIQRLDIDPTRKVDDLSTGNRQKLGVAQAFMHEPELLILDEPTAGLDPLIQLEVHNLIVEARAGGRTVFLSSHILPEVERVADRVAIIREGRILEVETMENLKARAVRRLQVRFAGEPPATGDLLSVPGVQSVDAHGDMVIIAAKGSVDALIKALSRYEVVTLRSEDADLEQIFLDLYRGAGA